MATADPRTAAKNLDTNAAVDFGCKGLVAALRDISSKHSGLFKSKANERAITHVLACCFERHFTELIKDMVEPQVPWTIDCEYNRILEKHRSKTQPYGLLLGRLAILRRQKANTKNKQWRKYLRNFENEVFDKTKQKLELDRDGRKRLLIAKKRIVPDIILHQRTLNDADNNAIAIEVKPPWGDSEATLFDLVKLSALTTKNPGDSPTYQHGIFLQFDRKGALIPGNSWLFGFDAGDEPMAIVIEA